MVIQPGLGKHDDDLVFGSIRNHQQPAVSPVEQDSPYLHGHSVKALHIAARLYHHRLWPHKHLAGDPFFEITPCTIKNEVESFRIPAFQHSVFVSYRDDPEPVVVSYELRHERRPRLMVQLLGASRLLEDPLVHHRHSIAHHHGLRLVMGDVDEGRSHVRLQGLQLHFHMLPKLGVQCAERFVQQQDCGVEHQAPGYGDALFLPARKLADLLLPRIGKPHPFEHVVHLPGDPAVLFPSPPQPEGHVFKDVHHGEKSKVLENEVNGPPVRRNAAHVLAVEQYGSPVLPIKTGDHAQEGRLAAP